MITRWSDYSSLSSLQYSLKDRELGTRISKRERVFTMNLNILNDFHKYFSEFFVVFILSLSNMIVGERNYRCERENVLNMVKLVVLTNF